MKNKIVAVRLRGQSITIQRDETIRVYQNVNRRWLRKITANLQYEPSIDIFPDGWRVNVIYDKYGKRIRGGTH